MKGYPSLDGKEYTNWHRKLPLRDMNKFFLPLLSLLETDYKSDDYGRDSGYCKHCNERAFDKPHHALTDYPKFCIGIPAVRTDGRSVARAVYGHVINKFSRMGSFTYLCSSAIARVELHYYSNEKQQ